MPSEPIQQFPHCDSSVLHPPGLCQYCDRHPEWQELRKVWDINFTGENDPAKLPCPSLRYRSEETINRWPGNRAKPPCDEPEYCGGVDREPEDDPEDMPPTGQPPKPTLLGWFVSRMFGRFF